MDGPGSLAGDFASGDSAPVLDGEIPIQAAIKREQDSTDDFEHLDREPKRESPQPQHGAARTATESFLDMERERFGESPRLSSAADKLMDHQADKFTDSESDAGDSPLHRPQPVVPLADPTPVLAPAPSAHPAAEPKVVREPTPEPPAPQRAPVAPIPEPKHEAPKPKPETSQSKPAAPQPIVEAPHPEPPRAPTAHVIEAEVIFCQMGLDAWFDPKRLHPEVESLIYWRDPARSGAALGAGLVLLVSLACCSVVSVLAYGSLLALSAAVGFRLYKNVLQAVQKTNDGHPFKSLLECDIAVPAERAQSLAAGATAHLNAALAELRRLFLVEDLVDSLKFGVLLWCLTYVGACFNGITLIILGWVALFTLPKAYEMNKAQVDANLQLARDKINEITAKVRAAVPLGRKSESEKDK